MNACNRTVPRLYPRSTIKNELLKEKATFQNFAENPFHVSHEDNDNNVQKSAVRGGERYIFGSYDEPWSLTFKCLDGVYNVAMAISNYYVPYVTERQRAC